MASERSCGAWYRAGGCILPKRHDGPHRNSAQQETDRLRDQAAEWQRRYEEERGRREAAETALREIERLVYVHRPAMSGYAAGQLRQVLDAVLAAGQPERGGETGGE